MLLNRALIRRASAVVTLMLCAAGCARRASPELWREVSGEHAFAHVRAMVALGPRVPGSEPLEKCRSYIEGQLRACGWTVVRQTFTDDTPRGKTQFTNLFARFGRDARPRFLLCSHYDTKIFDSLRFVGANDGGSSTGLVIELGRVLSIDPSLAKTIELVFFDGEEAVESFSDRDGLYGSRFFANDLKKNGAEKPFRGGMVFDMVGDRSLGITLPVDSPPGMARDIFAAADALHQRDHFSYFTGGSILDDHSPLNEIGIPTIDLIDFDYPPWHTAEDTLDKISPESLSIVGQVAIYYLTHFLPK
jgi:hypothetical protein